MRKGYIVRCFVLIFLLNCFSASAQNTNCNGIDTLYNGVPELANLPATALKIDKHIQTRNFVYLLGSVSINGSYFNILSALAANTGRPVWSKKWQSQPQILSRQDFLFSDGYLYSSDIISSSMPFLVVTKWDSLGNNIWSKQYNLGSQFTGYNITFIPTLSMDENELYISMGLQNQPGMSSFYEGIYTTALDTTGNPIWAKLFGVFENSSTAFFTNKPIGVKKLAANQYYLFSETSGWPFYIPGTPPVNQYKWIIATDFSTQAGQNQYTAQYYLPNITGTVSNTQGFCYAAALSVQRLQSGNFMLYSHNLLASIDKPDDGFFFFQLNHLLQASGGCIVSSKRHECGNVPFVLPSGKIITSNMQPLSDSFTVATIENDVLLEERKYPKYVSPNGPYTSTYKYISALEDDPDAQFMLLRNQKQSLQPYTEVHIENEKIRKPQCSFRNVQETSIMPVNTYSHAITWDTTFTPQVTGTTLPIVADTVSLMYQANCGVISRCDSIQILSPDSVCLGQQFSLTLRKNSDCYKHIQLFQNAPSLLQLINIQGDSLYTFKATQSGNISITARFDDCNAVLITKQIIIRNGSVMPVQLAWHDTTVCKGQVITLQAPLGYKNYYWNNSTASSPIFIAALPGWYTLRAESICGLITSDSAFIRQDSTNFQIEPKQIFICLKDTGHTKLISNAALHQFNWQPSFSSMIRSSGSEFIVWPTQNTTYIVTVLTNSRCPVSDTISVDVHPLPDTSLILSQDTFHICTNEQRMIATKFPFAKYVWSSGDTINSTILSLPGKYKVNVCDRWGCKNSKDFEVLAVTCLTSIYIPSAFSPDGNGLNDIFKAIYNGVPPKLFELKVFNRWGQLVFTTSSIQRGWNGTYNGTQQPAGAYIWQCNYQFSSGNKIHSQGTVTLIR